MYESFFNLRRKPFELLPNPDFLYPSRSHKKVLSYLDYGIREHSGFILLTGEVGTGKTTLIRQLIKKHLRNVLLARVFHTNVESRQLLAMINADLGLDIGEKDKPALLRDLQEFLIEQYAKRRPVVLIIDEAQNLSKSVLEEVRMLSNLETENNKLLHIILVGQPQLRRVLSDPDLLQLRQRIQIICNIEPLAEGEIEHYIRYRLEAAGNRDAIAISPDCYAIIHAYTRGIPRLINILCDYVLLDAFANESREVSGTTIHEIAQDLNFNEQYWESDAPPVAGEPAPVAAPVEAPVEAPAEGRSKHTSRRGGLLKLDRRLQRLESAQAGQLQTLTGELQRIFESMNQRMDALWQALEDSRNGKAHAPAQGMAEAGRPPMEPEILDLTDEVVEEGAPPPALKHKEKTRPWLKWLLLGHS